MGWRYNAKCDIGGLESESENDDARRYNGRVITGWLGCEVGWCYNVGCDIMWQIITEGGCNLLGRNTAL
jgi:hypothetical protein